MKDGQIENYESHALLNPDGSASNITLLIEMIANNLNLLLDCNADFDIGLYETICEEFGYDLKDYLDSKNKQHCRFKSE